MEPRQHFTNSLDYLGREVKVFVDRPIGSVHPRHLEMNYGVNYGFVPGTKAQDGEELDAYILGVDKPIREFVGICIAVIKRQEEEDDKLIIVPSDSQTAFSDLKIRDSVRFQEQYFKTKLIRMKRRNGTKLN